MSATDVVLLVILAASGLFGLGCTMLGLLGELRQNWPKH